ncbi:MAG: ATP-binding cassette domain-containing protein [Propionibacteriaceae bacterium]|nr:ATP-binding cassette domain-containing protein [Propionibacteriaceae bacterium]
MTTSSMPTSLKRAAPTGVAVVFWILLWQFAALSLNNAIVLASPLDVVNSLLALMPQPSFWQTVAYSLLRISAGFLIAFVGGTALAWLASLNHWLKVLITLPIRVIRSVPVVSFIILVLIWADSSSLSITISALMVLPIIFANVEEGIAQRDSELEEMAKVFDLSPNRRWWAITLPQMLPYLIAACRVGIGLAWKAGISAEVIGLPSGSMGERLFQAKLYLATGDLFAWTGVIIVASLALEKLIMWALARFNVRLGKLYSRSLGSEELFQSEAGLAQIELEAASFSYGETAIVEKITAAGKNLIITGSNGSGKTTLLRLLLGSASPSSGQVSVPAKKAAVFQTDRLIEHLTASANINLVTPTISAHQLAEEFHAIGLPETAWKQPVRELSGGQRRRVCIVRALTADAALVCLDEPFTGIAADDLPTARNYVLSRSANKNLAIITHDENDVSFFTGTRLELP